LASSCVITKILCNFGTHATYTAHLFYFITLIILVVVVVVHVGGVRLCL
jgi:hypothetical protein